MIWALGSRSVSYQALSLMVFPGISLFLKITILQTRCFPRYWVPINRPFLNQVTSCLFKIVRNPVATVQRWYPRQTLDPCCSETTGKWTGSCENAYDCSMISSRASAWRPEWRSSKEGRRQWGWSSRRKFKITRRVLSAVRLILLNS